MSTLVGHFQEFEDEYLETMYEFHEKEPLGLVRTGDLAGRLNVSPASATEMVQRLASRGYLEYIPYKGVRLTEQGLQHGQKMKRRHRLAEVLLDILPYEGDAHETACRLEHAIDDDMEVALSRLIGPQTTDPSGRPIPAPTDDISQRLQIRGHSVSIDVVEEGITGSVVAMLLPMPALDALREHNLGIGSTVARNASALLLEDGTELPMSKEWLKCIFVNVA